MNLHNSLVFQCFFGKRPQVIFIPILYLDCSSSLTSSLFWKFHGYHLFTAQLFSWKSSLHPYRWNKNRSRKDPVDLMNSRGFFCFKNKGELVSMKWSVMLPPLYIFVSSPKWPPTKAIHPKRNLTTWKLKKHRILKKEDHIWTIKPPWLC